MSLKKRSLSGRGGFAQPQKSYNHTPDSPDLEPGAPVAIAFLAILEDALGGLAWQPLPDGMIHRFHVPGDPSATALGWYVLNKGDGGYGAFGSWSAGGAWYGDTRNNRRALTPCGRSQP